MAKTKIRRNTEGTGLKYDSGVHIHYFNTKARDETFLTKLMQYLADSDADNNSFGSLSQQVNYHKYIEEGGRFYV